MSYAESLRVRAARSDVRYNIHVKRTNLVLDERLLDQAVRVLGVKTYSAAVNVALEEVVRVRKIQSLPDFFGRIDWQGDLAEMREDKPRPTRRKSSR